MFVGSLIQVKGLKSASIGVIRGYYAFDRAV